MRSSKEHIMVLKSTSIFLKRIYIVAKNSFVFLVKIKAPAILLKVLTLS